MQIFLPFSDFQESVNCLDPSRLGNGIYRECLTLIRGKWKSHPVSKMWSGHKHALAQYALCGLSELTRRGRHYPHHIQTFTDFLNNEPDTGLPHFIGDERFHASHRAALLAKKFDWYSKFGWKEEAKIDYFWPI